MSFRFKAASSLAGVALLACASALPPVPNVADATRVQSRFSGSSIESLQAGRTLYMGRCGSCHALRDPSSLSPEIWVAEVHDMSTSKGVHLSADDEQRITAYLVAVSSR